MFQTYEISRCEDVKKIVLTALTFVTIRMSIRPDPSFGLTTEVPQVPVGTQIHVESRMKYEKLTCNDIFFYLFKKIKIEGSDILSIRLKFPVTSL
jgi:hypothetical protein